MVLDLANTTWAFATASQLDIQLFATLARATERRLGDFNVQNVANTAWALTDSAACALGSCRSEAIGGGAGGDGSRSFLIPKDERPKLRHFSLQDAFFSTLKRSSKKTSKKHGKKCENRGFLVSQNPPQTLKKAFQIEGPKKQRFFEHFSYKFNIFSA